MLINQPSRSLIKSRLTESRYHDAVNALTRLGWSAHEEQGRTVLTHEKHRRHHLVVHDHKHKGRYPIEHYYRGALMPGFFFNPLVAHREISDQDDHDGPDGDNDADDQPTGSTTGGTASTTNSAAGGTGGSTAPSGGATAPASGGFTGGTSASTTL